MVVRWAVALPIAPIAVAARKRAWVASSGAGPTPAALLASITAVATRSVTWRKVARRAARSGASR